MERSARAIPLYPRNVRRLPGPPVYPFFGEDGKPPWLGDPKAHSPHDMFIHAGFESRHFLFCSGSHGKGTSPHHPIDTCTHDLRYTCPGSSSGLMTFNGSDGVPWPCHQPWYIYCHWLPNTWYKLHPSVELLRWTRQRWLHCDCVNMGRPVCESVCV